MRKIFTVLLICSVLTACAEPMNKAQKGALIGAASGALLGQAVGGDTKGTLIGAGLGAAAGAGIGHYMDKQEQALFATLSSKQKAAVHKAAAAKKAKPLSKDDQIAKLKAQLAAAEAKEKKVGLSVLRPLQSHPLNPASCTQAG